MAFSKNRRKCGSGMVKWLLSFIFVFMYRLYKICLIALISYNISGEFLGDQDARVHGRLILNKDNFCLGNCLCHLLDLSLLVRWVYQIIILLF